MGRYVKGEYIYILGKITEVNPENTTEYRVQTHKAKFYVSESQDEIRSNPADVYTASELYAMFIDIAKMSEEDLNICFGEDEEITNLNDLVLKGWSITEIREKFVKWHYGNLIMVGDMVYYTPAGISPDDFTPILCSVIGIVEGDIPDTATDNIYSIYSDQTNTIYQATRAELTYANKRSSKVNQSLSNLKEATQEGVLAGVRGGIAAGMTEIAKAKVQNRLMNRRVLDKKNRIL